MSAPVITARTPGQRLRLAGVDATQQGVRDVGAADLAPRACRAGSSRRRTRTCRRPCRWRRAGRRTYRRAAAAAGGAVIGVTSLRVALLLGSLADGRHDVVVAGTPTEVAGQASRISARPGVRVARQQLGGRDDEPGRAEAALDRPAIDEGALERRRARARREPGDRRDLATVGLRCEDRCRSRRPRRRSGRCRHRTRLRHRLP